TCCRTSCCTPAGNRQSCPSAAFAISQASSPIASAAPSGSGSPYVAVTDHAPGPESTLRLLWRGHWPPSVRTRMRWLSSRYAEAGSTLPSMTTSVTSYTGAGSRTSDTCEHEQPDVHDPHVRLNQRPPISAGSGHEDAIHGG